MNIKGVIHVPTFDPRIIKTVDLRLSKSLLKRTIAIAVRPDEDCIIAVATIPNKKALKLELTKLVRMFLKRVLVIVKRRDFKVFKPKRNKVIPPVIIIIKLVISKYMSRFTKIVFFDIICLC